LLDTIVLVFPLILFFLIGYSFKKFFSYPENTGDALSKIILYITLPVTIFLSVSTTSSLSQSLFLPFACLIIQLLMFAVFYLIARKIRLDKNTECIFITTPLITNTLLFMAPFFYLAYGAEGITKLILYDLGNAVTIYFLAQYFIKFPGGKGFSFSSCLKTLLSSVPIWAFILGLLMSGFALSIPEPLLKPMQIIREVNVFLPIFLLGFYFVPELDRIKLVLGTITLRMILGLILGISFSFMFINPMDKITVIMAAAAPVGILSMIFASHFQRNVRFASSIISYSTILALLVVTVLNYIFNIIGLS
jgi:predicted permease